MIPSMFCCLSVFLCVFFCLNLWGVLRVFACMFLFCFGFVFYLFIHYFVVLVHARIEKMISQGGT